MKFYEVLLAVVQHGREIGRVCVLVSAMSRFDAALAAEGEVEDQYGSGSYGHIIKIDAIEAAEYYSLQAA